MATTNTKPLSEKEALTYLKVLGVPMSRMTLFQIRKSGKVPFTPIGGRIFYHESDLKSLVSSRQIGVNHYETT